MLGVMISEPGGVRGARNILGSSNEVFFSLSTPFLSDQVYRNRGSKEKGMCSSRIVAYTITTVLKSHSHRGAFAAHFCGKICFQSPVQ